MRVPVELAAAQPVLFVDGVYLPVAGGPPVLCHLPAPTGARLQALVQQIAVRVGRLPEWRSPRGRVLVARRHRARSRSARAA